jgi:hypothetical protein
VIGEKDGDNTIFRWRDRAILASATPFALQGIPRSVARMSPRCRRGSSRGGAAMTFTDLSGWVRPGSTARLSSRIVTLEGQFQASHFQGLLQYHERDSEWLRTETRLRRLSLRSPSCGPGPTRKQRVRPRLMAFLGSNLARLLLP